MYFWIYAAPRLDATSIDTTVAFQFDGSLLLILSIQVKAENGVHCYMYTYLLLYSGLLATLMRLGLYVRQ